MNSTVGTLDTGQFAAQYELLRAQARAACAPRASGGAPCPPRGVGLALLLREGVSGWLKALQSLPRPTLALPSAASLTEVRSALSGAKGDIDRPLEFGSAQQHDITILLASLVLSTRQLPGRSPSEGGCRPCH